MTSWYVVKVSPGKERLISNNFNEEISIGKIKNIKRFVCPTEKVLVNSGKKKVLRDKIIYSGYLYFETEEKLTEKELKAIGGLPDIMGILGNKMPALVSERDLPKILKDDVLDNYNEDKRLKFIIGEEVRVIDGAFKSFNGTVVKVVNDNVVVDIKIFGRGTNVDLLLNQIEKL